MLNLQKHYKNIVRPDLLLKYHYKNDMEVPYIKQIILNMSISNINKNKNHLLEGALIFELITGQKAIFLKAKKSIAAFNLRKDIYTACKINLRNTQMYSFFTNLIMFSLPRIREFKGMLLNNVDNHGNYTFSIKNAMIFPEIEYQYELFSKNYGFDISIVTSAKNQQEIISLLSNFQFPFFEKKIKKI